MFDMHYDLLTKAYMCKLENNCDFLEEWIKNYNENNITGLIASMCFMSKQEMEEEYNKNYYKDKSVCDMFKESVRIINNLLPDNIDCIYGLEGCDYLRDLLELQELYNNGLRSICLTWNEPNKYGSGIRDNYGLTDEGKKIIVSCIGLGIAIDLSHLNEKTFDDVIGLVKKYKDKGYKAMVYASHSNSKKICDRMRNLSDDQLYKLKSVDGYVGIMSNCNFVYLDALKNNISENVLRETYIEHIKHIGSIVGFDHVLLSTDDMSFSYGDDDYKKLPIYNYANIKNEIERDLKKVFDENTVYDILKGNSKKLFKDLNVRKEKVK